MKTSRPVFEVALKYIAIIMVSLYVGLGVVILSETIDHQIPDPYVLPIGLCLLGYGLFRAGRIFMKYYMKR